jgi:hypothetical protein
MGAFLRGKEVRISGFFPLTSMLLPAVMLPMKAITTYQGGTTMPDFFMTAMGRTFYDHTLPTIAKELCRLNGLLERIATAMEKQNTGQGEGQDQSNQEVDDGKA